MQCSVIVQHIKLRRDAPDTPELKFECGLKLWKAHRILFLTQSISQEDILYFKIYVHLTLRVSEEKVF